MKKFITTAIIILAVFAGKAQDKQAAATGFWVIESNKDTANVQIIKFYNADLKLVYEERLQQPVDITKKKNQKMLNTLCSLINRQKELAIKGELISVAMRH